MLQGQERWDKIIELKDQGKTYSEIAPFIGLGSGKAVSVWVARNRKKYDRNFNKNRTERKASSEVSYVSAQKSSNKLSNEPFHDSIDLGENFDMSQFDNDDIETFLTSILNMCEVDVTKFHIHKDEENERWTVGILAELKSRNKTIFPYNVRIRTTAAIGKYLPELTNQEEIDRKKIIANAIKSAAQEAEIMSAAMEQNGKKE
ncbi:MAG: hypothetical protein ACTSQE_04090 [Candidatus Heimdallarchaeaceae archaeon]